jgi:hypothetical protein
MGTPNGMRHVDMALRSGMNVHLYSSLSSPCIVVQLRASVRSEMDLLAPGFKVVGSFFSIPKKLLVR